MKQSIKLSDRIYQRLGQFAEGFETPESVIERLLDFVENQEIKSLPGKPFDSTPDQSPNRYSKYRFKDKVYGKGRLVLAVVTEYCGINPGISFSELLKAFPNNLQGSHGVFSALEDAEEISDRTGHKRHFIKLGESIQISDGVVAVCTEWGAGNIGSFVDNARHFGFEIDELR